MEAALPAGIARLPMVLPRLVDARYPRRAAGWGAAEAARAPVQGPAALRSCPWAQESARRVNPNQLARARVAANTARCSRKAGARTEVTGRRSHRA